MTTSTPGSMSRLALLLAFASSALAQPAPAPAPSAPAPAAAAATPTPARIAASVVSPEVHADRRITFRLFAPNANKASVIGQWDNNVPHPMTKDDQGVWSVTVGPAAPGWWIHNFNVDGIDIADPVNPQVKVRMRTSASLVSVPGDPASLWDPRTDVPHGSVEMVWHNSKVTGDARNFHVYTPPGYDPTAAARYPVLYLLHGNNGTAADWTAAGRANFMADNLIAAKRMVPMIIVMPSGHTVPFGGPQTQRDALFERYITEEVIPTVDAKYRVAPGTANRAIMGLSMGGGQALKTGLAHLELFSAVGAFSSANVADFTTRFEKLLADSAGTNAKLKLLWIGCGRQDTAFAGAERLDALLNTHKIRHTFFAMEGYHDYVVWRRCFEETAPLLFRP